MHLKNGKATGSDAISIETIRALDDIGVNILKYGDRERSQHSGLLEFSSPCIKTIALLL